MKKIIEIIVNDKSGGHKVLASEGERLFDVLRDNGFYTASFCGGNGLCGKCGVEIIGQKKLSCRTYIEEPLTVNLKEYAENIVSESGITESEILSGEPYFTLDIGTTTLALALVDKTQKCVVEIFNSNNPQSRYGADVISRIGYCADGGLGELHDCLIEAINMLIKKAAEKYKINSVKELLVAGNTVMLHFLMNVDCSAMGTAPYTPSFLDSQEVSGESIGISYVENVRTLPCFAAFAGADIFAGMNAVDIPEDGKYSLLIDLGTNAEIALFSKDEIIVTSAAAGPCFEGANIICGMSALSGAVSSFKLNNGIKEIKTVGNNNPIGICGTGLIDIIAELLRNGEIDETGYLKKEKPYNIFGDVSVYQEDIRQFQVAKSAVRSAVEVLLNKTGIGCSDIDTLYLSGGFSSFINIGNAAFCGLFPNELSEKCKPISNSSLLGTVNFALNNFKLKISENQRYIDLMTDGEFSEKFLGNINFK